MLPFVALLGLLLPFAAPTRGEPAGVCSSTELVRRSGLRGRLEPDVVAAPQAGRGQRARR